MLEIKERLAEYRWDDHQKRELRQCLLAIAEEQACGYGRTRTGKTWQDSYRLCNTNDEGM